VIVATLLHDADDEVWLIEDEAVSRTGRHHSGKA
jgi:hypothetical protein